MASPGPSTGAEAEQEIHKLRQSIDDLLLKFQQQIDVQIAILKEVAAKGTENRTLRVTDDAPVPHPKSKSGCRQPRIARRVNHRGNNM